MTTTTGLGAQSAAANGYATFYATLELRMYDGTPPTNAKAALSSNVLCATHTLAGFGESNGTITANAIASATISATSGVGGVEFGRIYDGATCEWQGIVGSEITITPNADYVIGGTSNVTSLTMSVPDA